MAHHQIRYSECFKRKVVSEIEDGKWSSLSKARAAYGIKGADTLSKWLRRYANPTYHPRIVRVMEPTEEDELQRLRRRVKELEHTLVETQLESVTNRAYFNIVCRETGIEDPEAFKKSVDQRLSKKDAK